MKNTWDKLIDVKVKELNEHHKKIIKLFIKLQDAIVYNEFDKIIVQTFKELEEYIVFHFSTEEKYLALYNYHELAEHIKEHHDFKNKISELKKIYETNELKTSLDLLKHLQQWIFQHIAGTDKKYSTFLNKNGIY
jgi:hemerythrin-like metal-binding protein